MISKLLVLSILLFTHASCRGTFSNKIDEMGFVCGDGVDPSKRYVKISGPGGSNPGALNSISDEVRTITTRNCVERPESGQYLVLNSGRTLGAWISKSSSQKVELEPIATPVVQDICSSLLMATPKGFLLKSNLSPAQTRTQQIEVLLKASSGELIHRWSPRAFEEGLNFELNMDQSFDSDEVVIEGIIRDRITDSLVKKHCPLLLSKSEIEIFPSEPITSVRKFHGIDFQVVKPGYVVNFYIDSGFKDANIEYCVSKLKVGDKEEVNRVSEADCVDPLVFSRSLPSVFQDGLWVLKYRASRGLENTEWQSSFFLVEVDCVGTISKVDEIRGKNCTSIKGDLLLSDPTQDDVESLAYLASIRGNLRIEGISFEVLDAFPNLTRIYGDLTIQDSDSLTTLIGFQNLLQVDGTINLWSLPKLKEIMAFPVLGVIWEDLDFHEVKIENIIQMDSLTEIRGVLRIDNATVPGLSFLRELKWLKGLELVGSSGRRRDFGSKNALPFSDLKSLESLDILIIRNNYPIVTLDGLRVSKLERVWLSELKMLEKVSSDLFRQIDSLALDDCPKFAITGNLKSARIKRYFSLAGDTKLLDLRIFDFADEIQITLKNSNIPSLAGLSSIQGLSLRLHGWTTAKTLHDLEELVKVKELMIEGNSFPALNFLSNLSFAEKISISNNDLTEIGNFDLLEVGELMLNIKDPLNDLSFLNSIKNVSRTSYVTLGQCLPRPMQDHLDRFGASVKMHRIVEGVCK